LEVIVQGMYSSLRELRTASAKPPARTARRVLSSDVGSVCSSAPEIPIYWDPQEAFADTDERGRLRDRVWCEILQLCAVVVA
jgi:hypothetical protein